MWHNVVVHQQEAWQGSFRVFSTSWKSAVDGCMPLPLHDASVGRAWPALQPLALLVVSVRAFRSITYARVRGTIDFV